MKRIILDFTLVRERDLAVALLTHCNGPLCAQSSFDKKPLREKNPKTYKNNPKKTTKPRVNHALRSIKFPEKKKEEKPTNTSKYFASELSPLVKKKIILTAPQGSINHLLLTTVTQRQPQKRSRKAGEMKWVFV